MQGILKTALKIIRTECKSHKGCCSCPLRNQFNECSIKAEYPDEWTLTDDKACIESLFREE